MGNKERVQQLIKEHDLSLSDTKIIDPRNLTSENEKKKMDDYVRLFYEKRKRKGTSIFEATDIMRSRSYYGVMMVEMGDADAMIGGLTKKYPYTVRPALQIIGAKENVRKVTGIHILMTKNGPLFLGDTSINHDLDAKDIADIAELVAEEVRRYNIQPKIAMVTYSNFGSVAGGTSAKIMRKATKILHEKHPDWIVDGEMQAHLALDPDALKKHYPFSKLVGHRANTLIFPNLSAANIAYNLLSNAADMDVIGPILVGLKKPIHVLQLGATVRQIVDMVGIAAVHAQENGK